MGDGVDLPGDGQALHLDGDRHEEAGELVEPEVTVAKRRARARRRGADIEGPASSHPGRAERKEPHLGGTASGLHRPRAELKARGIPLHAAGHLGEPVGAGEDRAAHAARLVDRQVEGRRAEDAPAARAQRVPVALRERRGSNRRAHRVAIHVARRDGADVDGGLRGVVGGRLGRRRGRRERGRGRRGRSRDGRGWGRATAAIGGGRRRRRAAVPGAAVSGGVAVARERRCHRRGRRGRRGDHERRPGGGGRRQERSQLDGGGSASPCARRGRTAVATASDPPAEEAAHDSRRARPRAPRPTERRRRARPAGDPRAARLRAPR